MKQILKAALTLCKYCNNRDCRYCIFLLEGRGKCAFESYNIANVVDVCRKPNLDGWVIPDDVSAYNSAKDMAEICPVSLCSNCPLCDGERCIFYEPKRPSNFLDKINTAIKKDEEKEAVDALKDALSAIARECRAHHCEDCHLSDKYGRCYKDLLPTEWYDSFFKLTKED